ncbi:PilZ domain-containing protein [Ramlibacter sp. PS4R-6]|uniref:PilZ domain-containing protein n=1 Tax=Ramlibacter sp. PS4R-6 TaxID=3133438 RepID=UPI0030B7EA5B
MFTENRHDPRQSVELPIRLGDGSEGVARNVSPSGLYLEIRGQPPEEPMIFLEMDVPGEGFTFRSHGKVVRMDHRDGVTGIAVRLEEPHLERC